MEKSKKEIVSEEFVKNERQLLSYALHLTGDINEAKDLLQEVALHSLIKAENIPRTVCLLHGQGR